MPTEEIMIEVADNLAITITGGSTQYTISATTAENIQKFLNLMKVTSSQFHNHY